MYKDKSIEIHISILLSYLYNFYCLLRYFNNIFTYTNGQIDANSSDFILPYFLCVIFSLNILYDKTAAIIYIIKPNINSKISLGNKMWITPLHILFIFKITET